MNKAPGVLVVEQRVLRSAPAPRLRLLIEWEPRHRVFLSNLADLVLRRELPPIRLSSRPARFWDDVFVASGARWSSFAESLLWHFLVLILFVWVQSRVWTPVKTFSQKDAFHHSIVYYPPTQSFKASESRAPNPPVRARVKQAAAAHPAQAPRQPAIPVRAEQKPSLVTPPDIQQAMAQLPNLPGSHRVAPMTPVPTAGMRRNSLANPTAVAPQPQVDSASEQARRMSLPQAAPVAPAPDVASPAGRNVRGAEIGGARIVPPSPSVQNASASARMSSLSGTGSAVVPPPPSVQRSGGGEERASAIAAGLRVIDPPPSVLGTSNAERTGRFTAGSEVVAPSPSIQSAGDAAGMGRAHSLPGGGPNVVMPAPSVQGTGAAGMRMSSIPGPDSKVVPPAPAVQGSNGGGAARMASLSGSGTRVVPAAPSIDDARNSGANDRVHPFAGDGAPVAAAPQVEARNLGAGGRAALAGDGPSPIAPPSAPVASSGNAAAGGPLQPMDPLPVGSAPAVATTPNEDKSTIEELPLGVLGVVFAAPGSSYFSNFEVFVAKRRVPSGQLQLIKLVYEFLPYQKRLSEYDLNHLPPRVIKLKVTPDPNCDESLGQIIQPAPDPNRPVTEYPKLPAALSSADMNAVLPCYRTTADDFQRAMLKGR